MTSPRRSMETLAYEQLPVSTVTPYHSTALILHGVLGRGGYWRPFCRTLLSTLADPSGWRLVLVDLRNHGDSVNVKGLDPPHDMFNTAQDLANLIKSEKWAWPDVVIGHSMSNKVALQFAESCSRGHYGDQAKPPKLVWVLDSFPGEVRPERGNWGTEMLLKALQSIPTPIPSEQWVVDYMNKLGFPEHVSNWISKSLIKDGDHVKWVYNLDGAVEMFNSYWEKSYMPLLEHPPKDMEIAVVRAENSEFWDPDSIQQLESLAAQEGDRPEGKFSLHVLPNSGHWVHKDNPESLLQIIAPKLASLST